MDHQQIDREIVAALATVSIEDEAEQYEFRGDAGDYTPSATECFLLVDFASGLMNQVHAAIRPLVERRYSLDRSVPLEPRQQEALDWVVGRLDGEDLRPAGSLYTEEVTPRTVTVRVELPEGVEFAPDVVAREHKVIEGYVQRAVRTMLIQSGFTALPDACCLTPEHPSDERAMQIIRDAAAMVERLPTSRKDD